MHHQRPGHISSASLLHSHSSDATLGPGRHETRPIADQHVASGTKCSQPPIALRHQPELPAVWPEKDSHGQSKSISSGGHTHPFPKRSQWEFWARLCRAGWRFGGRVLAKRPLSSLSASDGGPRATGGDSEPRDCQWRDSLEHELGGARKRERGPSLPRWMSGRCASSWSLASLAALSATGSRASRLMPALRATTFSLARCEKVYAI